MVLLIILSNTHSREKMEMHDPRSLGGNVDAYFIIETDELYGGCLYQSMNQW